jgi:large subunit ribosomal protein L17
MRNKISHRQLGRDSAHRQALFRNIVEALVTHGRIRTTLAKAKEVRRFADRLVTWGKLGGSVYHTKVHAFLRTPETVKSVFEVLAPRYKCVAPPPSRTQCLGSG